MKTVLYVDDDEEMVDIVKTVLRNSGYRISSANSGQEAIDRCSAEQPDLILMDLNMPGLDGFETTIRLRETGYSNPVVVLTASESNEDRTRAKTAGCNDYILKTVDMGDVEGIIDRYIGEAGNFELENP